MPDDQKPQRQDDPSAALAALHEREAATREILQVISRSRDDEQPVFNAILERAAHLCGSHAADLKLSEDDGKTVQIVAHCGAAFTSFPVGMVYEPSPHLLVARSIRDRKVVHVPDISDDEIYRRRDPVRVRMVEVEGIRTYMAVPLISGDRAIGSISLFRLEVQPFTNDEIALVETFAAQAVIAIENVRQFRELQTRLEREAATREILEVISRSRTDEKPVFDAILEYAARLCDAPMARLHVANEARTHFSLAAAWGEELRTFRVGEQFPLDSPLSVPTAIREARTIHTEDLAEDSLYRQRHPLRVKLVDEEGIRTYLTVPLVSGGEAFGSISLSRREVKPFSARDIALVQTFAAQAVIAIENVRQFRELQTRLEREAATREILQVISRSRADTGPVFAAILENARRLCDAPMAMLSIANEARTRVAVPAALGARTAFAQALETFDHPIDAPLIVVRPIADGRILHMADCTDDDLYRARHPTRVLLADVEGVRTILAVPMISDGISIGAIILYRREVQPFDDGQIELVKTFADQAAIAVENVRQFRALAARTEEVQALNAGLEARVAAQVGELERLGRLKRFLSPQVADAVVSAGDDRLLSSHRALIATLFCDIRGFTAFCETAEPEETIEVLQTYHEEMGRLIDAHGAGVDHRMGDGIMVLFNDPLPCDDSAGAAVRLAMDMRARMAELCAGWKRLGHRLGFGVGISLGYATVGMVGSEGRYEYTASGTAVNLAARLCDKAEDGDILLSPRACLAVQDAFRTQSGGDLSLKGIHTPIEVFRVLGRLDA